MRSPHRAPRTQHKTHLWLLAQLCASLPSANNIMSVRIGNEVERANKIMWRHERDVTRGQA